MFVLVLDIVFLPEQILCLMTKYTAVKGRSCMAVFERLNKLRIREMPLMNTNVKLNAELSFDINLISCI